MVYMKRCHPFSSISWKALTTMPSEVIMADCMTGAGDSGIHFAQTGKRAALLLERAALEETLRTYAVVSLSSESRFLPPGEAMAAVRGTVEDCRRAGARIIFKKIDSTLRGNPGAEIEVVLDAVGAKAALLCAAMPKTGRTCRGGVLLISGKPLHETEAGRDPFNPVSRSAIADILVDGTGLPSGNLFLDAVRSGRRAIHDHVEKMIAAGKRILIADAETDADLAILGELLRDGRYNIRTHDAAVLLPVGAGGLAEAIAGPPVHRHWGRLYGRMLAVVGSLTDVSREQIEYAASHGDFHVLDLDVERARKEPEREMSRLVGEAMSSPHRHLLVGSRAHPRLAGGIGVPTRAQTAGLFALAAKAIHHAVGCSLLYGSGGDTAVAVAAALGVRALTLERECLPGVVLSSCTHPTAAPRWFATKAGGFGGPDILARLAGEMFQPCIEGGGTP
jgi:uncharacterized protein YgbK (DUF1537 family)